jgi:dihydroflavonol-4-reductase
MRGVYISTLAVNSDTRGRLVDESYRFEGRPLSVYDRTRAEAHRLAEEFIALRRRLPLIPARTALSWAHLEDVARAHLLAMEPAGPT